MLRAWLRNRSPLIDRFSGFEAQIETSLSGQRYEAAFIEHFWCAPYVEQVRPRAKRVFVDLYNVESAWHRSMAASESGALGLGTPPIRPSGARIRALLVAEVRSYSGYFP